MANRLDSDGHVLAYLGFDEANETDVALDESTYERDFTVFNSPAAVPARVNNGRQFDGSTTYCAPPDSAPFRLTGSMTLIVWIILEQVNSSGSFMRTILECAGADDTLYYLGLSNLGELVYEHSYDTGKKVTLKTEGIFRTGRYYSIALRRVVTDGTCQLLLYVDNSPVPWASSTVDGVAQTASLPLPTGGADASLLLGKSAKLSDGAYWRGTLDELSLHDVDRPYQPYLRAAYYRLTLSSLFFRLTVFDNVKSVGGVEMGGGARWWVYERDQNLYCLRENSLGLYSAEVPLTMGGLQPNGTLAPGATEKPTLIYDKVNDLLVVAFVNAGKVFRLSAGVGDAPQTQAMPYTVDTAGIMKVRDSNERVVVGYGEGTEMMRLSVVNRQPVKLPASDSARMCMGYGYPSETGMTLGGGFLGSATDGSSSRNPGNLQFTGWDSFGLYIPWTNTYGFAVYAFQTGNEVLLGYLRAANTDMLGRAAGHWPIQDRVFGTWYYVKPLDRAGRPMKETSNWVCDLLGMADHPWQADRTAGRLVYNRSGDDPQLAPVGWGPGFHLFWPSYVNRQPIKMASADSGTFGSGAGNRFSISCTTTLTAPTRKGVEVS